MTGATMHPRLAVHQICFADLALGDYIRQCRELGAQRIGLISPALLAPGGLDEAKAGLAGGDMAVQAIAHVFRAGHLSADRGEWREARDNLKRLIDGAAELDASTVYMLTGGHGGLTWEAAADCFCEAVAPCVDHARAAGIELAIENAASLYAEVHIAHTLADTIKLAEMADIGVCVEMFFCWAEADLPGLFARAMPRCPLVQLSDYVYGDRSLPARAVPGDGNIPLARLLDQLQEAGYKGPFDLELLGPRIEEEGPASAVRRAAGHVGELLEQQRA